jgi:hypothetical protein
VIRRAKPGRNRSLNRRAFLRGAAGVSVALPFLEGLPERSAWAAGEEPIFSLFVCTACGVVPERFFPDETGAITRDGLASSGKATSALAAHAEDLLFLSGIDWNFGGGGEAHSLGYCQVLTATQPTGSDGRSMATGPSADVVIASKLHPDRAPLTLFAGNKGAYIAERLSFTEQGTVRAAVDNPYTLYLELLGLIDSGGGMTPEAEAAARRLAQSRNSVHDLVRDDLAELLQSPRLSAADRQRLDLHLTSIRDLEIDMHETPLGCTVGSLDVARLEAYEGYVYDPSSTEEVARLHMSLVALAFACNYRQTATLQWGDGYDRTVYDVPSNERGWNLSFICHRAPSDSGPGSNPPDELSALAHAEIDVVRLQSFALGLDHFKERGLEDRCFVMWTNHFRDGPGHSFKDVPHILWGNAGGYLRNGGYVDVGSVTNDRLLNTLISAATQETGATVDDFGDGPGGLLEDIMR